MDKINPLFVHVIEVLTIFTSHTSFDVLHVVPTYIALDGIYFFFLMLNSFEADLVAKLALTIAPNAIWYHWGIPARASNPSDTIPLPHSPQNESTSGMLKSKVSHSSFHEDCDARIAARSQSISPVASFIRIVASAFCIAVLPSRYDDARLPIEPINACIISFWVFPVWQAFSHHTNKHHIACL